MCVRVRKREREKGSEGERERKVTHQSDLGRNWTAWCLTFYIPVSMRDLLLQLYKI